MNEQKYNSRLILFLFLFTILSGALRKWVIDNNTINNIITYIQIPILFTFLFIKTSKNTLLDKKFYTLFFIYIGYLAIVAFNPISPTIYHGFVGIVIHLGFWMALSIYLSNKALFETNTHIKVLLPIIAFEVILALFQNQLPRENIINQYAIAETSNDDEIGLNIALVGDAVRVTGTFSYLSGFTAFLIFLQFFVFSLLLNHKINNTLFLLSNIIVFTLCMMSGSRSSAFIFVLIFISFIIFQLPKIYFKFIFPSIISLLFIFGFSTLIGDPLHLVDFFNDAFENFNSRVETNAEEGSTRIFGPLTLLFSNGFPNPLFGNGLAITYPGIVNLLGTSEVAKNFWVQDDEIGRTILEGGYILLCLKLVFIFMVVKHLNINRFFSTIVFVLVFIYVPLSTNIYNAFFFLMGVIFLDKSLENQSAKQKITQSISN